MLYFPWAFHVISEYLIVAPSHREGFFPLPRRQLLQFSLKSQAVFYDLLELQK